MIKTLLVFPIRLLLLGYALLQYAALEISGIFLRLPMLRQGGTPKSWATHAPNMLSLSRPLVLGPLMFLAAHGSPRVIALLFVLMAVTDLYDGLLARKLNCCTAVGAMLDPLCDKLFFAQCVAAFWFKLHPPVLQYALLMLKLEGFILTCQLLGVVYSLYKSKKLPIEDVQSAILGKSKGFFEIAALLAVILGFSLAAQIAFTFAFGCGAGSIPEYIYYKKRRSKEASTTSKTIAATNP